MTELITRLAGRRVVASISGGKDSVATRLYLRELGIPDEQIINVNMDVGWEDPATVNHLAYLRSVLGPITVLRASIEWTPEEQQLIDMATADCPLVRARFDSPMIRICLQKGSMPSRKMRFCTDYLKRRPVLSFMGGLCDLGEDVVNVVGIRAAESEERSKMTEWESLAWDKSTLAPNDEDDESVASAAHGPECSDYYEVEVWRPILSWSLEQVIAIHERHGVRPNPLYLKDGIERVGCDACISARKSEIRQRAKREEWVELMRQFERAIQRLQFLRWLRKMAVWLATPDRLAKWPKPYTPPAWFQKASGPDRGRCAEIDDVVRWSRTMHGGQVEDRQELLFAHINDGCMKWGLCDTGSTK